LYFFTIFFKGKVRPLFNSGVDFKILVVMVLVVKAMVSN
jgi:hypothetical protein